MNTKYRESAEDTSFSSFFDTFADSWDVFLRNSTTYDCRIESMDDLGGGKIVRAFVPLSEMFGYSTDLRSKTQGRGNYSMFFDKYEPVPKNVQEKVLSDHKK